jgi:hypothetical protein
MSVAQVREAPPAPAAPPVPPVTEDSDSHPATTANAAKISINHLFTGQPPEISQRSLSFGCRVAEMLDILKFRLLVDLLKRVDNVAIFRI